MKSDALTDMLAILTAGGRNSGERSRARPSREYRDPAQTVEFAAERARLNKEKSLKKAKFFKGRRK